MAGREMTAAEWIAECGSPELLAGIERSEIVREGYGLEVIGLTRGHLEDLLAGRVLDLPIMGEYGALIYLAEEEESPPILPLEAAPDLAHLPMEEALALWWKKQEESPPEG